MTDSPFVCQTCGTDNYRAMVRYGSYILRCRSCSVDLIATSYMAIGPSDEHLQAVVVDDDWNVLEIVGEGAGRELYDKVYVAAAKGRLVTIVKPGKVP